MIYESLETGAHRLHFVTHVRAQRGRGVLFATTPFVVYLATLAFLFFLATRDLSLWTQVKAAARGGFGLMGILAAICFALGFRIRDEVEVTSDSVRIFHRPALGPVRQTHQRREELSGLAFDPSLRSLGADVLLVAVRRDGSRVPIAEGEPHSGQIHALGAQAAQILRLPLEPPKFTAPQ
jgi:hypothetical protein